MSDSETTSTEEISEELTAKLIHFHDVTQIDDLERCKSILEQHGWNMEQAVQSTLSEPAPFIAPSPTVQPHDPPNVHIGARHRSPSPPQSIVHRHSVMPRQMIYIGGRRPRPPEGLLEWSFFFFVSPLRYTFNQVFNILKFVYRLFFPDPREMITDPLGDVQSFVSDFEAKYPHHPQFFNGTYGNAQNEAKNQIRFLLVYLHDPDHKDTDPFCHSALCHPESVEYINRNMILWGCSINKPEGYRVSKIIRNPSFPLLAVVCLYENRMTVVGRLEGRVTSEELIGRLSEIVEVYEPTLIAARADKESRNQTQIIRKEQDEAYLISLQKDKEKMDKKRREEEEDRRLKEQKEQVKREKELKIELGLQRRARCKEELSPEPEECSKETLDLVIKLPNGTRLKRRFHFEDTVKTLHDFIYAQDDSPSHFQVYGNFPRRPIPGCCTDSVDDEEATVPLLRNAGLNRSDTLFVQAMHTDEESEEDSDSDESSR